MRVVDILVPVALDQAYSYRVPEGVELAPGDVVGQRIPNGQQQVQTVTRLTWHPAAQLAFRIY